jgi:hypothetical protein
MDIQQVSRQFSAVQYDGTNGREIATDLFEAEPINVTDNGITLAFKHPSGEMHRVAAGSYILFTDNRGINGGWCDLEGIVQPDSFPRRFRTSLEDRVAALEAVTVEVSDS